MQKQDDTAYDMKGFNFENNTKLSHREENRSAVVATKKHYDLQNIALTGIVLIGLGSLFFGQPNTPVKINNFNSGDGAKVQVR